MQDEFRYNLVLALLVMSLGGLLLHFRIHPVFTGGDFRWVNLIPVVIGLVNVIIIPLLFLNKNTVTCAYLLTGLSVILGIITMSHLSIFKLGREITFFSILLKATLADSLILFGKFFIAKVIFDSYFPQKAQFNYKFPQTFRFLFPGWWLVHFIGIAIVYSLGVSIFS
ncbi:MAG: hypothetical protein NG737_01030 [Omnitrophica bacterium]|nr:hypothetical protein [Candidatus Omnitrophota bacterium]